MKAENVARQRSAPLPSTSEMASGEMTHARAMAEWPDYAAEWKAPGAVVARAIRVFRQVALMAALGRSRGAAPVCRITEAALSTFRKMMLEMTENVERLDASGPADGLDHPDDGSCLRRLVEIGQNIENHLGKSGSEYMAPISAFAPISAISKGEDALFRPYLPDGERFVSIKATLASIQTARMQNR